MEQAQPRFELKNLKTVANYARLCGITPDAVYRRQARRNIMALAIGGVKFIDIAVHPPIKTSPYRQRVSAHPYPTATALDEAGRPVTLAHLVTGRSYAEKVNVRTETIYHRIITGKMQAVVIDGEVFIDTANYPPADFQPNRKRPRKRWEMR